VPSGRVVTGKYTVPGSSVPPTDEEAWALLRFSNQRNKRKGEPVFRIITSAAIAVALTIGAAGAAHASTSANRSGGWHFMNTTDSYASRVLRDRTPARTYVGIGLQKKRGNAGACRATITFKKGGRNYTRHFEKWATTRSRIGVYFLANGPDRTINATVKTNGKCIVVVGVK